MNIALWAVQGLLALMFLFAGGMKLFAYDRFIASAEQRHPDRPLGLSKGLVTFIGASEVAGALGLVLPQSTAVLPVLTALAAVGLAVIMILATRFHLQRQEAATVTIVLAVLCIALRPSLGCAERSGSRNVYEHRDLMALSPMRSWRSGKARSWWVSAEDRLARRVTELANTFTSPSTRSTDTLSKRSHTAPRFSSH